jgi:hypothetical protein
MTKKRGAKRCRFPGRWLFQGPKTEAAVGGLSVVWASPLRSPESVMAASHRHEDQLASSACHLQVSAGRQWLRLA